MKKLEKAQKTNNGNKSETLPQILVIKETTKRMFFTPFLRINLKFSTEQIEKIKWNQGGLKKFN